MEDGHLNKCKDCTKADVKHWQHNNPARDKALRAAERKRNAEKYYRSRIKKQYGLTIDKYEGMLKEQNYACAICPNKLLDGQYRLHVDHSHKTGKVRGLLCRTCNTGLGMFKDSFDVLLNAAKYIQNHEGII